MNLSMLSRITMGMLLFSSSAIALPFQNGVPTSLSSGANPVSTAIADVNGDNFLDMVTANQNDNTISLFIGDGSGGFAAAVTYAVGTTPTHVAIGDVNNDSRPDIVTCNWGSASVSVLLGAGAGQFGTATDYAVGNKPLGVEIGDLNGDSFSDIVTANNTSHNVSVLMAQPAGGFAAAVNYAAGTGPNDVTLANMDGINGLDIVVANRLSHTVSLLRNDGSGLFPAANSSALPMAVSTWPYSIATADMDGDGNIDIVTANRGATATTGNTVAAFRNLGGASGFAPVRYFPVGTNPVSVVTGDFSGDGLIDVATANFVSGDVSMLLGAAATAAGELQFHNTTPIKIGTKARSVALGDVDGDGRLDLAATDSTAATVIVQKLSHRFATQLGFQSSDVGGGHYSSVIWTGSEFVAVGYPFDSAAINTGAFLQSVDGQHWSSSGLTTGSATSVASDGSQLVMVGLSGKITTKRGNVYQLQASGTTNFLYSVVWSGTQFVAVGEAGTILTSPDGVSWTTQTSNTTEVLRSVAWNGTRFVAVGGTVVASFTGTGVATILTSTDGVSWVSRSSSVSGNLFSVTWDGSQFLLTGQGSGFTQALGQIQTSPDGISWTLQNSNMGSKYHSIAWNGVLYVAVGGNGGIGDISTSSDGMTWSAPSRMDSGMFNSVSWSGTQFVAVGERGQVVSSSDGINWVTHASNSAQHLESLHWNGTQYVAFEIGGASHISSDGLVWSRRTSAVDAPTGRSMVWNGEIYVSVGTTGGFFSMRRVQTSPDGFTWTTVNLPIPLINQNASDILFSVAWSGREFVAVGTDGFIMSSPDGLNWSAQNSGTTNHLRSVVWSGSQFVAVGDAGVIVTSPDGGIWTLQSSNSTEGLQSIVWSGSQFVAVGRFGTVVSSPDGVNWSNRIIGTGLAAGAFRLLSSVAWSGTQFMAVGGDEIDSNPLVPVAFSSSDGVNWTAVTLPGGVRNTVHSIIWSGTKFIAVGYYGMVLSSTATPTLAAPAAVNPAGQPWSGDLDGDGVFNESDAFPNDAAASIDRDGDGIADGWNAGKTAADSTTGLILDAFPLDPTRWTNAAVGSATVSINKASFTTGETITLNRAFSAAVPVANADLYIALALPDGTLLCMTNQPFNQFSAVITPLQANVPVPNVSGSIFSYTFTGAEPAGTYTWYIGIADPGTLNFNNSIVTTTFTFTP